MPVPIPDLKYNANAFFGTLSFNGEPYYVSIPWGCVYALVGEDSKGMVWKDEMPPTIMETKGNVIPITSKVRLNTTKAKCKPKELRSDRSHLRLVK
jgi:stringent starvation protein B